MFFRKVIFLSNRIRVFRYLSMIFEDIVEDWKLSKYEGGGTIGVPASSDMEYIKFYLKVKRMWKKFNHDRNL